MEKKFKKVELPEFIRLSHYTITLEKIPSEISEECAEQQGSFHSRTMRIYLDESIIENGFENTAAIFSISDSSKNGGNLGWISENSIDSKILNEDLPEGFFKTEANTVWTCKKKVFIEYMEALGMADSIPDARFK